MNRNRSAQPHKELGAARGVSKRAVRRIRYDSEAVRRSIRTPPIVLEHGQTKKARRLNRRALGRNPSQLRQTPYMTVRSSAYAR